MLAYPFDFLRYKEGEGASILHRDGLSSVRVISDAAVLRRRLLVDFGLSEGLAAMPAEKLVPRGRRKCEGFDIYVVEYKR